MNALHQMIKAARLMMVPGEVHELRVINAGRHKTISGYFDNPEQLARAAHKLDGTVPGVYLTLNPCKPELLARACNRVQTNARFTTSDSDIAYRAWLGLDFDPVRPSHISSSNHEHGR